MVAVPHFEGDRVPIKSIADVYHMQHMGFPLRTVM